MKTDSFNSTKIKGKTWSKSYLKRLCVMAHTITQYGVSHSSKSK